MTDVENTENTENTEDAAPITVTAPQEMICDEPNPEPADPGYISVDAKKNSRAARIFYNFGANLANMTEKFGAEVVFAFARAQMKVKLQSSMRSYLEASRNPAELMEKFHPGVAMERMPVDMSKATESYFKELTDEEQDAMIAKLMEAKG